MCSVLRGDVGGPKGQPCLLQTPASSRWWPHPPEELEEWKGRPSVTCCPPMACSHRFQSLPSLLGTLRYKRKTKPCPSENFWEKASWFLLMALRKRSSVIISSFSKYCMHISGISRLTRHTSASNYDSIHLILRSLAGVISGSFQCHSNSNDRDTFPGLHEYIKCSVFGSDTSERWHPLPLYIMISRFCQFGFGYLNRCQYSRLTYPANILFDDLR